MSAMPDSANPFVVLDHIRALGLALVLLAIAAGVGGRTLRRVEFAGPLEALLVWTAFGLGIVATAIVAVGLVFGVNGASQWILLIALGFIARRELVALPALLRDSGALLHASSNYVSRVVLVLMLVAMILHALTPPLDWDTLMYHLQVPVQFLVSGTLAPPADSAHYAYVGLGHMLFLPLLAAGSDTAPAVISAFCTMGIVLVTFEMGRLLADQRAAGVALVASWSSTILLVVGSTARVDTILTFYLLLVHLLCARAQLSRDRQLLFLAAALGGFAVGIKLNALVYLLALLPLGAWLWPAERKRCVFTILAIAGFTLVAAAPWALKNGVFLGDPLYPFLKGTRLVPWLADLVGDTRVPSAIEPALGIIWQAQGPFSLYDFLFAPGRISVELEAWSYRPSLWLFALPLALLHWRSAGIRALALPPLAYAVMLIAFLQPISPRYLLPALPPLVLVSVYVMGLLLDRLPGVRNAGAVLMLMGLATLAGTGMTWFRCLRDGGELPYLAGLVSRAEFVKGQEGAYADAVAATNQLGPRSRVLLVAEARGYYFRVPVLQDNVLLNWPLVDAHWPTAGCPSASAFTHVLWHLESFRYYIARGMNPEVLRLDDFPQFANRCLRQTWSNGDYTLYAVRSTAQ